MELFYLTRRRRRQGQRPDTCPAPRPHYPDSDWTESIAPAGFLLTLILSPALTGVPGPAAGRDRQARPNETDGPILDAAIAALDDTESALRVATDFNRSCCDLRLHRLLRLRPGSGSGPGAKGCGAAVLAEPQIVYSSRTGALSERSRPAAIWYLFAVPAAASPAVRDPTSARPWTPCSRAVKNAGLSVSSAAANQGFRIKRKAQVWKLTPSRTATGWRCASWWTEMTGIVVF